MTTRFHAVHIAAPDLDRATTVYEAILGSPARPEGSAVRLSAGTASVVLSARGSGPAGVAAVDLVVDSLGDRAEALADCGRPYTAGLGRIMVELHGIEVRLSEASAPVDDEQGGTAVLDHLALRVTDLEDAGRLWAAATGVEAEFMGLHPVSGGAFSAARLHLGSEMIELVSPTPGVDSPMAHRLESHGEGPAALAVPSSAIDATRSTLDQMGAKVLRSEPHWMVHPADAGGVLVQLTPRVGH